jgi:nucleoside 2-deoxyribosyltransferase
MATLYLAGGLFNAGERLHLLYLDRWLKTFGDEVILPMVEALKFFNGTTFDLKGIAEECRQYCANHRVICVVCLDGTDCDSGTAVEYGIAISLTGRAITYRTDFRTVPEQEVGVNGMFNLEETSHIYGPCFFTSLEQTETYYHNLALKIHDAAQAFRS